MPPRLRCIAATSLRETVCLLFDCQRATPAHVGLTSTELDSALIPPGSTRRCWSQWLDRVDERAAFICAWSHVGLARPSSTRRLSLLGATRRCRSHAGLARPSSTRRSSLVQRDGTSPVVGDLALTRSREHDLWKQAPPRLGSERRGALARPRAPRESRDERRLESHASDQRAAVRGRSVNVDGVGARRGSRARRPRRASTEPRSDEGTAPSPRHDLSDTDAAGPVRRQPRGGGRLRSRATAKGEHRAAER
jgi:hypothetical protein